MSLLLTQGRAVGVVVVAALQDPRKEVVGFRNLFPTKVALRLDEPAQVSMILGDGARDWNVSQQRGLFPASGLALDSRAHARMPDHLR